VLVVLEHQSHRPQRLDDLQPQRADGQRAHVRSQPARNPDVVLLPRAPDTHKAVHHVVVLVQPQRRGECHLTGHIAETEVMPVVPGGVSSTNPGEGRRDLVVGVLIHSEQHVVLFVG
jgi:hypothetical protein